MKRSAQINETASTFTDINGKAGYDAQRTEKKNSGGPFQM
jgi:hypothetical protein